MGTVYDPQGGKVGVGERGGGGGGGGVSVSVSVGVGVLLHVAVTWALCTALNVARWVLVRVGV